MGYGTGYIDAIISSGNLTITTNTAITGNITSSGTVATNLGNIYPLVSTNTANTTSGTTVTVATGIPSWTKRITIVLNGISMSGVSRILIQLGYGSPVTYDTTNYQSTGEHYDGTDNPISQITSGFVIGSSSAATTIWNVLYTLINVPGSNTWIGGFSGGTSGGSVTFGGGRCDLSGTLTAIRLNTVNGTDTFDAGTVNILYE